MHLNARHFTYQCCCRAVSVRSSPISLATSCHTLAPRCVFLAASIDCTSIASSSVFQRFVFVAARERFIASALAAAAAAAVSAVACCGKFSPPGGGKEDGPAAPVGLAPAMGTWVPFG